MRRVASIILCALLISTAFAFFGSYAVVTVASAEVVEGEGNCFEITNSTYLNVTLCSSEVVNVTLESIPEVVSFTIENVTSAESTHITISGFEPNETYYRHEDGLLIESFVADVIGNYSYTQDLSEPHHVFILEIASTLYIRDDGTGGDCISIGTWDSGKKTCTLTGDVYETIAIVANGITLDGDGHRVERGTGYHGVGIGGSSVTVMNTEVTGFNVGIYLGRPSGNVIEGNTISNNYFGIYMFYASGHTISGNTFSGNDRGIYLHWDSHTVSGNTFSGNDRGIYLESWGSNTISGNTFSGGLYACSPFPPDPDPDDPFPFLWCYDIRLDTFSNSNTVSGNTISGRSSRGIDLESSNSNTITGNTISGSYVGITLDGWRHLFHDGSSSNTITGNTVSGSNYAGIRLKGSGSGNTISGNTVLNSGMGIFLHASHSNTMTGNTFLNNGRSMRLHYSYSNTISINTISNSGTGIYLLSSNDNTFYCNLLIENVNQLYNHQSANTWDNGTGDGNYWSDYEGEDLDGDGDGDTLLPHQEVDWHPLMNPCSANTAPAICSFLTTPSTEGTAVIFTVLADDPENDPLTYSFDFDSDGIIDESGSSNTASFTWYDDYTGTASVYVTDGEYTTEATAPVLVANVPPDVFITGPAAGSIYPVNTAVTFTGMFTDAGTLDTHTAEWTFDDITISGTVTESDGSGTVTDNYEFTTAGVYLVTLTITDDDDGVGTAHTVGDLTAIVVIYDPSAGFITGGGWFESPAGALASDTSASGRAGFGFVSKYQKGADVPKGNAEFRFQAGDLKFKSESYDWLVIAGHKGMFKGTGEINGEGNYGFLISAIDGELPGGQGVDKFRIKIWDKDTGEIIYDNNVEGGDDDADPTTPVIRGEIKIHR